MNSRSLCFLLESDIFSPGLRKFSVTRDIPSNQMSYLEMLFKGFLFKPGRLKFQDV